MGLIKSKEKETLYQYNQHFINSMNDVVQCGLAQVTIEESPTLLWANEYFYNISGYNYDEFDKLFNKKLLNIIHEFDYDRLSQYIFEIIMFDSQKKFDVRINCKNGQIKWISCKAKRTVASNGEPIALLSVSDITDTVSYQRVIDEITENVPCGLAKLKFSSSGIEVLFANYLFYNMFSNDSVVQKKLFESTEFISKLYNPIFVDKLPCPMKVSFEYFHENELQEKRWMRANGQYLGIEDNTPVYMFSFEDITSEKKIKGGQNELLSQLSGGLVSVIFDDKGTCVSNNDTLLEVFSLSEFRLTGGFYSFFVENERAQIKEYLFSKVIKGEPFEFSSKIQVTEKRKIPVRVCGIFNGEKMGSPYYNVYIFACNEKNFFGRVFLKGDLESIKIDDLTGCYSKDFYQGKIDRKLQKIFNFEECWFATIILENFIEINEKYGYDLGDTLLRNVSELIKRIFGVYAVVGRTGGIEFSFLVRGKTKNQMAQDSLDFCNGVKTLLMGENKSINISCKMGITSVEEEDFYANIYERTHSVLYKLIHDDKNVYEASYLFDENVSSDIDKYSQLDYIAIAEEAEYDNKLKEHDIVFFATNVLEKKRDLNNSIGEVLEFIGNAYSLDSISLIEIQNKDNIFTIPYKWTRQDGPSSKKYQIRYEQEELEDLMLELANKDFLLFEGKNIYPFVGKTEDNQQSHFCCIIPVFESGELHGYIQCEKYEEKLYLSVSEVNKIKETAKIIISYIVKERADEIQKAKNEFMSRMSHEIRTPMNAISGMTDMLLAGGLDGLNFEYANLIKSASNNLISIVDDILDISKIDTGDIEINEVNYQLQTIIDDLTAMANSSLYKKNISFTVSINNNMPKILCGDEKRIKQIVMNLLSNAIKFTEKGFIQLSLDYKEIKNGDGIELIISVKDSGIGINKEDFEKIFTLFSQVDSKLNRNVEGVGLGLSVAKQLAEYMGGHILVESETDIGSKFSLVIKQKVVDSSAIVNIHDTQNYKFLIYEKDYYSIHELQNIFKQYNVVFQFVENKNDFIELVKTGDFTHVFFEYSRAFYDLKFLIESMDSVTFIAMIGKDTFHPQILSCNNYKFKYKPFNLYDFEELINGKNNNNIESLQKFIAKDLKVLIVDDNPVNLRVAQGLISAYQCKIVTALSGYEAIDILSEDKDFDMVFIDHMMPEMDGIDTLKLIRSSLGVYGQELTAVALTANVLQESQKLFKASGFQGFLAKPIVGKCLHKLMDDLVVEDKKQMLELLHNDNSVKNITEEDIKRVQMKGVDVESGLRCCGNNVEEYLKILSVVLASGNQKVQAIKKYAEEKNYELYGIEAHALKSVAASIGAIKQSELAREHEFAVKEKNYRLIDEEYQKLVIGYQRLLFNIQEVLVREENKEVVDKEKKAVEQYVWERKIKETIQAIQNFEQKKAKAILKELVTYKMPSKVENAVGLANEKMKIYDDETAQRILEDIMKEV